ncbi:carboxy terminal-processing peptidase [Pedobacter sp. MC2016-24]|uniref:carboxy terminal-processing peptidase n=1 Tax=Pedobacter sp. MC2016-24 TaxID=2780090 RepID=UPI00187EB8EE|nr:carboxy terminal-processing peptidase [Pedobacter sp. MC2016-24]MBE9598825.1 carboxy terminal-processing peptidase [Pedobacter sp. MC2016-24]
MDFKIAKEMLKRILLVTFTAAVLACHAAPQPQQMVPGVSNIVPDEKQALVCKEIVGLIENYNYKKIQINDSISSLVLDKYIKDLDPSKSYFLASDIKDFEKFRYTLDDDFRIGNLNAPFYIFNVYLKRYNEWVNYSLAQIKVKQNFDQDETFVYDREKMPWSSSTAALNDSWKKKIKFELLNLKVAGTSEAKNVETLTKRYQVLKSQAAKANNQDVFQIIMDAFTETIDPHTNYFNPSNAQAFNEEMARSFEGIGAKLQVENEVLKISEIIPGGPAFKSKKLNAGDRIVGVAQATGDFEDIIGWRIENSIAKIKGPKGTKVRLKIIPAGKELSSKPVIIELTREKIIMEEQSAQKKVKTITSNGQQYKIGIITVPAFYADFKAAKAGDPNYKSTTRDVRLLIDTLKNKDKVDAIVMDLRSNGGGSLVEAIDLTGLFIDKGPVVQVKDLKNNIEVDEDTNPGVAWNGPFGVLVNRLSASASEIFAGAIQDYGRGIIMGTQTYGKGTVQSSIDMNQLVNPSILQRLAALVNKKGVAVKSGKEDNMQLGQINLTMAKFYRVNGSSTQHKGVMPDIEFPSAILLDKIGEDTEPSALPWDEIQKSNYVPVADLGPLKQQLIGLHKERMSKSLDYKILQDDIADFKNRENEVSVSLNETKLKAERDSIEAKNLVRTNTLRTSRGLPPVKKGDKIAKEDNFDFVEDESLKVMADLMQLKK